MVLRLHSYGLHWSQLYKYISKYHVSKFTFSTIRKTDSAKSSETIVSFLKPCWSPCTQPEYRSPKQSSQSITLNLSASKMWKTWLMRLGHTGLSHCLKYFMIILRAHNIWGFLPLLLMESRYRKNEAAELSSWFHFTTYCRPHQARDGMVFLPHSVDSVHPPNNDAGNSVAGFLSVVTLGNWSVEIYSRSHSRN